MLCFRSPEAAQALLGSLRASCPARGPALRLALTCLAGAFLAGSTARGAWLSFLRGIRTTTNLYKYRYNRAKFTGGCAHDGRGEMMDSAAVPG